MARTLTVALALTLLLAAPAWSQISIELSPYGGGYVPLTDVFDELRFRNQQGQTVIINGVSHDAGVLFGGRVGVQLTRLGVEGEVGYALSDVGLAGDQSGDAQVLMASLNLTYTIFEAPFSPLSIYVSGGGGLVSRTGDFYDRFDDTTDPAGAVGIGAKVGLGPLASLRFDLKDYISSFEPSSGLFDPDSQLQNDVVITAGLVFRFSPTPTP